MLALLMLGCGTTPPRSIQSGSVVPSTTQPAGGAVRPDVLLTGRYENSDGGDVLVLELVNGRREPVHVARSVEGYQARPLPLTYLGRRQDAVFMFALVP